jgi:UDPglucose--hexose-1-phosphate uridylyltransferase
MTGELRFDRLSGEWVNIVGHRQDRPNLPTGECPFCVGGLEAPESYDTRWFVNRWPAFDPGDPPDLVRAVASGRDAVPSVGASEVVLYSPRHVGSLGSLGVEQIRKVVDLWADRTAALLARPEIEYVLVFESRGPEVGATIHHPHGQIYAYPFVPPVPRREAEVALSSGCDVVAEELHREVADGRRVVHDGGDWVGYVPFASAYPFGMRLAPRAAVGRLDRLDEAGRVGLVAALQDVLGRYDRLWASSSSPAEGPIFPYLMWIHQAPAHDDAGYHLHVHLAPPQRAPGVARFLAAGEAGSGTFQNPVAPEDAAAALRDA